MGSDFKQMRPIIPESGPLLWELVDDEDIQPSLQIVLGFTPGWFREAMGLDYGEQWHTDPIYRQQTVVKMKKTLNRRFPRLMLGGSDPDSTPGSISVAYGTTLIPAILGAPIVYMDDNWPANPPANMNEEEERKLEVPSLESSPVFCNLMEQMDIIEKEWGKVEGVLNYQGILNNAFRIRGQDIFTDFIINPKLACHVLDVCAQTMIEVIRRVYARQKESGVENEYFVTSNCVVNMLSGDQYERFILPFDNKISNSFKYFGIHNCAWTADPYLNAYRSIGPLGYLDFGIDSNMDKIKMDFPYTRLCVIYSAVDLKNKTKTNIGHDLQKIHDALTPCEIIIGDIDTGTPDEMVMDFYQLAANVWDVEIEELVPRKLAER